MTSMPVRRGVLAGCCSFAVVFGTLTAADAGGKLTTLYSFGGTNDGKVVEAGVLLGAGKTLYGTTVEGGPHQCGTVFKLTPDGTETILHAFFCDDGGAPSAPLISDRKGNLYGTAVSFGQHLEGSAFEYAADGRFSVLHTFAGGADGANPGGALLSDGHHNFYGTTTNGAAHGAGSVFRLSSDRTLTTIYAFTNGNDGGHPVSALIADGAGNLYGTTWRGGDTNCPADFQDGCGTVFKISPKGKETVLHVFAGGSDGASSMAGLIADAAGNLYGTTANGGGGSACNGFGCGTVFKITPKNTLTILYAFTGGNDGLSPMASLLLDAKGNLYGTTQWGGVSGQGTVFKLTPAGTETVLHSFVGGVHSSLITDARGRLYGTTLYGGANNYGTVFRLTK